jgi:hypothetical protein
MRKLIYLGHRFYSESKTMMSSVYTEDGYRYDWGFMQRDLENGEEVHIRQADPSERAHYEKALADMKERFREREIHNL